MCRWVAAGCLFVALGLVGCSSHMGEAECFLCGRSIHAETVYEIESAEGRLYKVCCARCGAHFRERGGQIARSRVADYHSREMIDAEEAFFVEDSSVTPCSLHEAKRDHAGTAYSMTWDRCAPSVVAFASGEEAARFQATHGGLTKRFEEIFGATP